MKLWENRISRHYKWIPTIGMYVYPFRIGHINETLKKKARHGLVSYQKVSRIRKQDRIAGIGLNRNNNISLNQQIF